MQKQKSSILDKQISNRERPYSQNELISLENKFKKQLKLSKEYVYHTKEKSFYLVKKFGKKEKEIIENKKEKKEDYNLDIGSCSIQWKLKKTPRHLKQNAYDLIDEFLYQYDPVRRDRKTYFKVQLFKIFHIWLYYENYDTENNRRKYNKRNKEENNYEEEENNYEEEENNYEEEENNY